MLEDAKNAHLYRAILESPRDLVVFALDRDYRYLLFNEAHRITIKRIWNVDITLGMSLLEIVRAGRPDDVAAAQDNFDRALAGEHVVRIEEFGSEEFTRGVFEDHYQPIFDRDGAIIGLSCWLKDITEQRRAEEALEQLREQNRQKLESLVEERTTALRQSEALYRTLVDNSPSAVIVHRGEEVLFANPASVALWRARDAKDLATRRMKELVPEVPELLYVDRRSREELPILRIDGEHADVEWSSIPVEFEGQSAQLVLVVDVTERKRAEAERRRIEEQMRHTQKLESLGLLAGGIAHDFNNLLVGVLGNADLALNNAGLDEGLRIKLERIKLAAIRASELTAQMLAYSGKGPFVVRALDVSMIAKEMTELIEVSVPKGARLVLDLPTELPAFEGDAAQIRQLIMNLITNAADAVGEADGTIAVTTSLVDLDRSTLASSVVDDALAEGRYLCLEVRDTGVGMDESTRARLFDPFFTTKQKGRGLGLAAAIGIVRAHHGTITVDSTLGKGSTFRVYLPTTEGRPTPAPPPTVEDWRGSGTVLVADDEPRVRQVLTMMLTDIGFHVLEADSAHACLEMYRTHAGAINAIMVDLMMPGGGGREVVRALRAEGHWVPVIVSSGYSEEAIGPELRADSKLGFLEKPFEFSTFVRTLRAMIEAA
ncbi:sensory box histidine kinase/response regulator [Labilithrix luteola]|uniref:histidine kinase n=1 Tax=Labilithrix luteola TaxID=1391654 RepID=A0A0K1Q2J4_9BACT|nr:ATP-binding protein [Labilithrix luteola]AKU99609.1 sensory box histidine kinase/response regulator [Labilithrix luteola]